MSPSTLTFTPGRMVARRLSFSPRKLSMWKVSPATLVLMGKWLYTIFMRYSHSSWTPLTMLRTCAA
jgi:hypothetical protein